MNVIEGFQLSAQQRRLWALRRDGSIYSAYAAILIEGSLEHERLREALRRLVRESETLRARFHSLPGLQTPVQVVTDSADFLWREIDLDDESGALKTSELWREFLQEELRRPFDFAQGPPLRATLLNFTEQERVLLLTASAMCADTWTMGLVARDLCGYYERPEAEAITEESASYSQFSAWQDELLESAEAEAEKSYWRNPRLTRSLDAVLPFERPAASDAPFVPQSLSFPISAALASRIEASANAHGITPSTFLLAAWQTLLWRLTERSDVTIGVVCDGRAYQQLRETSGPIAKHLPQLCRLEPGLTFKALLRDAHEQTRETRERHEYFSWEQIMEGRESPAEHTYCSFSFDYRERATRQEARGLAFSALKAGARVDRFKIQLACVRDGNDLLAEFNYDSTRFSSPAVINLADQYRTLLESAVNDTETAVDRLNLLSGAERERILREFNPPEAPVAGATCIHHLIEEQARRTPDAVAALSQDQRLTYAQLNAKANQLAHFLTASGAAADSIVAVCLNRSVDFLVATLAVLKAGAAYLPLDPAYPADRTAFMLDDSGARFILTHQSIAPTLPQHAARVFRLDADWKSAAALPTFNPGRATSPLNLAYLIYTSGSTGRPKGVLVSHGALAHSTQARFKYYSMPPSCFLLASPFPFDSSVAGIFWTLATGGALLLPMDDFQQDMARFIQLIADHRVSHLLCLPSLFDLILRQAAPDYLCSLSALILAGESCQPHLVQTIRRQLPNTGVYNEYGPTETTVWASVYDCREFYDRRELEAGARVPIGRPIANTRIHLLDDRLEPVTIGVPGHPNIGGAGVARGYLNHGAATAERFIPDPFSAAPGARLYRTGDLARYLPDGHIEFLGRIDHQVKIRGHRIEPGEIEAALNGHPAVKQSAVIAREDAPGERRLVAYVVTDAATGAGQLRAFLKTTLPDFMIPATFVSLEALPVTPNGKLDRKRLPPPDQTRPDLERVYVAPRTPVEKELAEAWVSALGVEKVGVHDNFFDLGGDSIRSIQALTRARERGINFSLSQLNQHPTVHDLAQQVTVEGKPAAMRPSYQPFSLISEDDRRRLPGAVDDAYPLARLQAGMLFHSEYNRDSVSYHDIASFHLRAPYSAEAIAEAVERLAARHAVLRTSFDLTSFSEPLQLVYRAAAIPCHFDDLSHLPLEAQEAAIDAWLETEKRRKFDWRQAPLLRFHLHLRGANSFQLSYTCHHAILDGWSAASMMTELFQIYFHLLGRGTPLTAPPCPTSFAEFIALERETEQSAEAQRYWANKLDGSAATGLLRWPVPDPNSDPGQRCVLECDLTPELSGKLRNFAHAAGAPLKSALLAAHLYVINLMSGQADVVTGVVSHGRLEGNDGERALGLFLNTLPLRLRLTGGAWIDLAKQAAHAEQEMFAFRRYPLAKMQKAHGGQPLFETTFNFVHFHVYQGVLQFDDAQVIGGKFFQISNLPLVTTFHITPASESVQLHIQYDPASVTAEQIEAMRSHYLCALDAMVSQPFARYEEISLLTDRERARAMREWNGAEAEYSRDRCVHELFAAQAARAPEGIAVVAQNEQLTYRGLNQRSNQLAHYLRGLGVGPEVRVGLCLERSLELIVGLLGILKAGGAYLPLDPTYPRERLAYLMEDAGVDVVLTEEKLAANFSGKSVKVMKVDSQWDEIAGYSEENPSSEVNPDNLAYVIYTSGSTGKPKGVLITHANVVRLLEATHGWFGFSEDDVWTLFHSYAFDFSVWEIWGALRYGGKLVVVPYWVSRSPEAFYELLSAERATVLNQTPSAFRQLIHVEGTFGVKELALRRVIFGGEALELQSLRPWFERHTGQTPKLVNMYGITETTVHVTYRPITKEDLNQARGSVIGGPIPDLQVYMLDRYLQPAPIGAVGEIFVGGQGLARGYFNQAGLSAERFIPNPFSDRPGERLYRSGDLARRMSGGEVEYLGRSDQQVKVRGYRIEVGEIESALRQVDGVGECAVEVRKVSGRDQLVAYIVLDPQHYLVDARDGLYALPPSREDELKGREGQKDGIGRQWIVKKPLGIKEMRRNLANRLPEYMIPGVYMEVERLPLTPSGKLDRNSLPDPEVKDLQRGSRYEEAGSEVERQLVKIWSEVLGVEKIGIHDNFFELGGDSILSLQITVKTNQAGLRLTPEMIFQRPTIVELASAVDAAMAPTAEQGVGAGPVLLTPIQAAFFEQAVVDAHYWNQAILLEARRPLDPALLEQAVGQLLLQHDALRSRFERRESGWRQFIAAPGESVPFTSFDLSSLSEAEQRSVIETKAAETQGSLNLSEGPLLRVVWFERGPKERGRLLVVIHHLIVDGVSWRILLEDLQAVYRQLSQRAPARLPYKTTSYQRWAERLQAEAQSASLRDEITYWTAEARHHVAPLPVDYVTNTEANTVSSAREVSVSLDAHETRVLLQDLPKAYRTQINDALLVALAQALRDWTRHRALFIELEGHGREGIFKDLDVTRTVGWFTAAYPALLEIDGHQTPGEALRQIKEQLRGIPNRGIGYGMLRCLSRDPTVVAQVRAMPQPEISFNYLGQFDQTFDDESLFGLAPESSGPERSLHGLRNRLLEINAGVIGGEFRAVWTYSENLHRRETIETIARNFITALRALITHCQGEDAGSYTPADFPLANLSQKQLDRIMARLSHRLAPPSNLKPDHAQAEMRRDREL